MMPRLGRYRIDAVLGKGAMGVVYQAFDPDIERVVALKTIRKEMFSDAEQADLIGRFQNEARAAGRLAHPNIVTVFDYGEDAESAYIAMEFVEGSTLDTLMHPGEPTALPNLLAWMGDLLQGLDYAHGRGVVHRDIKPANLLVTTGAQLKIGDFGVARIDSSTLTQAGSMIGTPSYMAPEQFRGDAVDGRADVFSSGVVLYQLLTGTRPFAGATSVVMQQILHHHPPPPSVVLAALGTRFDAVVTRAIVKSPLERFSTARAFHAALLAAARADGPGPALDPTRPGDNDRTLLASGRPASDAPSPPTMAGSDIVTATPWKREALPDVEALLARQIGPMARFLLKKTADKADSLDALGELLLPHIPSDVGRAEFQAALVQLRKRLEANGTGSGARTGAAAAYRATMRGAAATPAGYDAAWADHAATQLVAIIGPIGRVLARRAMHSTADKGEFLQLLASHIDNAGERERFLAQAGSP